MSSGTRSFEMARRLVLKGHKVYVLSSNHARTHNEQSGFSKEKGIHVWWLPVKYSNNMSYPRRVLAFLAYCYLAVVQGRKLRYDLVFATSTPLTVAIPGILLAKLKKSPFVLEVRDLWPELPVAIGALKSRFSIWLAKLLEKWSYNNANRIIGLSPAMCQTIANFGQDPGKISNIPNGCDIDLFNIDPERGRKFRDKTRWLLSNPLVIYTGALGRINQVDYLVKIAQYMAELSPQVRFLIIGTGFEEKNISDRAVKLGVLNKNLFMVGELPKNKLPTIYSAATVCTSLFMPIPEMEANSANKFFDGLAAGKPIMINYGGWQAELLEQNNAGIVVPPDDPATAVQQLNIFINDKDRLQRAGAAALRLAKTNFDRDKLYQSFEHILLSAADYGSGN